MNPKQAALEKVKHQYECLTLAQQDLDMERADFGEVCKEAHEFGIPDQQIADLTGYSRARIQQFRCGDPRKKKAAA